MIIDIASNICIVLVYHICLTNLEMPKVKYVFIIDLIAENRNYPKLGIDPKRTDVIKEQLSLILEKEAGSK